MQSVQNTKHKPGKGYEALEARHEAISAAAFNVDSRYKILIVEGVEAKGQVLSSLPPSLPDCPSCVLSCECVCVCVCVRAYHT